MGAANVLVSMAGDGAVLVAEDGSTYKSEAPEGKVKNSVGAGDSMVAGFLYGYLKSGIYEDAFIMESVLEVQVLFQRILQHEKKWIHC